MNVLCTRWFDRISESQLIHSSTCIGYLLIFFSSILLQQRNTEVNMWSNFMWEIDRMGTTNTDTVNKRSRTIVT